MDMDIIQRTDKLLTETERALVALANEAGATRDYVRASSLIELARRIQQLSQEFVRSDRPHVTPAIPAGGTTGAEPVSGMPKSARARNKLGQYPRFLREGENLVKVGWSKSAKAEYEHKSPKGVLAVLTAALTSANGRRVAMDKVLPLKDPATGSSFPDYQSYVCLAWLRSVGLVIQHGRQGYSLPKGAELEKSVESHWNALPTR